MWIVIAHPFEDHVDWLREKDFFRKRESVDATPGLGRVILS
jgi:hypothetical protein